VTATPRTGGPVTAGPSVGGPVTATPDAGGESGHPRHLAAGGPGDPRHPAVGAQGELGGASLVALALAAFLLLAGLLAVDVGALVAARAAAQTAADMAALAALTPSGGAPPARAATIASANGAELAGCACSAVEAVVTVRRRVVLVPTGLSVRVTARARAVLAAGPPRPATRWPGARAGRPGRRAI
jgi:secretion/DNA translocation related TadE-like protein